MVWSIALFNVLPHVKDNLPERNHSRAESVLFRHSDRVTNFLPRLVDGQGPGCIDSEPVKTVPAWFCEIDASGRRHSAVSLSVGDSDHNLIRLRSDSVARSSSHRHSRRAAAPIWPLAIVAFVSLCQSLKSSA